MLSSITPLGERGRDRSWRRTVTALALGASAAGALTGALAGVLGSPVPARLRLPLAAVAGLAVLGLAAAGRLPSWRRQVDETWLHTYRDWVTGLGYGVQLGAAFATIVPSPVTWMAFLVVAAGGSPLAGALAGAVFGLARALPLLATRRVEQPEDLARLHERLAGSARWADLGARAAAVLGAAGLVVSAAMVGAA